MSLERKKVLEMLAAGKITADEAEKLLEKLGNAESVREPQAEAGAGEDRGGEKPRSRYLRIEVDESNGKKVNMRVPLAFVRTGMAIAGVLPQRIQERLAERGIDIGLIAGVRDREKSQKIADLLQELNIDVDEDGKKVRIYCE